MSCRKFKEKIYLYPELSASEREEVDAHAKSCADCSQELRKVMLSLSFLKAMKADHESKLIMPDLGQKIMESVQDKSEGGHLRQLGASLTLLDYLRYSLAAASLFLVGLLITENTITTDQALPLNTVHANGAASVLHTADLVSAVKKRMLNNGSPGAQRTFSFYSCVQSCRDNEETTECKACLKQLR